MAHSESTRRLDSEMFRVLYGPLGVVRVCKFCKFSVMVAIGIPNVGRGYGMREGNKARGKMIQHFNTEHLTKGGNNGKQSLR